MRSDYIRYTVKNTQTSEEDTIHLSKEQEADQSNFVTADGAELEARHSKLSSSNEGPGRSRMCV